MQLVGTVFSLSRCTWQFTVRPWSHVMGVSRYGFRSVSGCTFLLCGDTASVRRKKILETVGYLRKQVQELCDETQNSSTNLNVQSGAPNRSRCSELMPAAHFHSVPDSTLLSDRLSAAIQVCHSKESSRCLFLLHSGTWVRLNRLTLQREERDRPREVHFLWRTMPVVTDRMWRHYRGLRKRKEQKWGETQCPSTAESRTECRMCARVSGPGPQIYLPQFHCDVNRDYYAKQIKWSCIKVYFHTKMLLFWQWWCHLLSSSSAENGKWMDA